MPNTTDNTTSGSVDSIKRFFQEQIRQAKRERIEWDRLHQEWMKQFDRRLDRLR